MRRWLLGALIALAGGGSAAVAVDRSYLFVADGAGSFEVAGVKRVIAKVASLHLATAGRTTFTPFGGLTHFSFAGAETIQPDLEHFVLTVDAVDVVRPDGSARHEPAVGRCVAHLSADAHFLKSLACDAQTGFGPMKLTFKGSKQFDVGFPEG